MTIVIEDGTGVVGANSYITVAQARLYASIRGVELPGSTCDVETLLIKAMDYLESFNCKYQGAVTDYAQSLQWPRCGVYLNGNPEPIAETTIPTKLLDAQAALAIIVNSGIELLPNVTPQDYLTEETVGPITVKYADPIKAGIGVIFKTVDALLTPLFGGCNQFPLRTVRV